MTLLDVLVGWVAASLLAGLVLACLGYLANRGKNPEMSSCGWPCTLHPPRPAERRSLMTQPATSMVAVDGTDALAFVIIRPGSTEGGVSIEAAATGMDKASAAYVLRHVAECFEREAAAGNAIRSEDGEQQA